MIDHNKLCLQGFRCLRSSHSNKIISDSGIFFFLFSFSQQAVFCLRFSRLVCCYFCIERLPLCHLNYSVTGKDVLKHTYQMKTKQVTLFQFNIHSSCHCLSVIHSFESIIFKKEGMLNQHIYNNVYQE